MVLPAWMRSRRFRRSISTPTDPCRWACGYAEGYTHDYVRLRHDDAVRPALDESAQVDRGSFGQGPHRTEHTAHVSGVPVLVLRLTRRGKSPAELDPPPDATESNYCDGTSHAKVKAVGWRRDPASICTSRPPAQRPWLNASGEVVRQLHQRQLERSSGALPLRAPALYTGICVNKIRAFIERQIQYLRHAYFVWVATFAVDHRRQVNA